MFRALPLYTFLNYCEDNPLEKEVLECGAGVSSSYEPLLVRFYEKGYKTHGIDISDERVANAQAYCEANGIDLDIVKGDMRDLQFADGALSFVYSYNAIFHMSKADIALSMREIKRVLKSGGLCFVNFLSVDDSGFGDGTELEKGEFLQQEGNGKTIHTYFEDDEGDKYLQGLEILYKEKRIIELFDEGEKYTLAYLNYIAQKK